MTEPNAPNMDLGLDVKLDTLIPGVPKIDEVEDIAQKTQQEQKEYAVSVYKTKDGQRNSLFQKSAGLTIFQPEVPSELKGKLEGAVFIHCHPVLPTEEVEAGKSLHMLPSGHGVFSGDFAANLWSRVVGDYLNIASKYGLTMNMGVEGNTREEDLTRTLREKAKSFDLANESIWKIMSGEKGGTSFNQKEFPQAIDDKFTMEEDVVLLSHNERNIGTRYFLHLSWDKLKELEPVYGGVDNLFFGDGLDKLTKHLGINVYHEPNMAKAARKTYAMPKERGV